MKHINECKITGDNKRFSKSEEGITFALQSEIEFHCEIVDIEKCVLKDEMIGNMMIKKCDWLFLVPKKENPHLLKPKAFYVELKGTNISEACEQLYHSIDKTKSQIANYDIEARVIGTKGAQPNIKNSTYYRKVKRLLKKEIEFCKVHIKNNYTHTEFI